MLDFAPLRRPRRLTLTPMIDVVFHLLVFFMLASQFGVDRVVTLASGGVGADYSGPPRLVHITADDVRLNGISVTVNDLPDRLRPLTQTANDTIVLRAGADASYQALMDVASALSAAGFTALAVVE
ncbi:biopolymer transporter ExbD [Tropicibacter sp. R16_0]|uniref:ExbD/TolR family protein n=1 Tax=Tropicibacter sp. R16_0 TaxID=2821102 RepID=UPI001AD9C4BB|nr:biopolymer transporter ExbD [Tropicibacter sp. R16_0]MBO9453494.1 biopolymer transporter ExbD [Tropicibacter sp. R16_0]